MPFTFGLPKSLLRTLVAAHESTAGGHVPPREDVAPDLAGPPYA